MNKLVSVTFMILIAALFVTACDDTGNEDNQDETDSASDTGTIISTDSLTDTNSAADSTVDSVTDSDTATGTDTVADTSKSPGTDTDTVQDTGSVTDTSNDTYTDTDTDTASDTSGGDSDEVISCNDTFSITMTVLSGPAAQGVYVHYYDVVWEDGILTGTGSVMEGATTYYETVEGTVKNGLFDYNTVYTGTIAYTITGSATLNDDGTAEGSAHGVDPRGAEQDFSIIVSTFNPECLDTDSDSDSDTYTDVDADTATDTTPPTDTNTDTDTGTATGTDTAIDTDGEMLDSSGVIFAAIDVAGDSDSFTADVAYISFTAATSGTYTILAYDSSSGHAQTGDYNLYYAKSPGANEGGLLVSGATITDTIDEGDIDSFTILASGDDTVLLQMTDVAEGALQPLIVVYSPSGSQITYGYAASVAEVSFTASETGIYTVLAYDSISGHAATGDYTLFFEATN
jgi:hypothetical protein